MSVDEALEKITHNVKGNVHNLEDELGDDLVKSDKLRNADENTRRLAKQLKSLAKQVESLCTVIQKLKEYE